MRLEERLREAPAPDARAASERARRVATAVPIPRRRRRRLAPLIPVAVLAVALVPSADAIAGWLTDLIDPQPTSAPPPEPRLDGLPVAGRVLLTGPAGAFSISSDGTRTRLGDYDELTWSPRGLFAAVADGDRLRAIEGDGAVRWTVETDEPATDLVWAPSGFRVAYRSDGMLHVVAGDGTGDRALRAVGPVPVAWRPGALHQLALARPDGSIELWDADGGERRWHKIARRDDPVVAISWLGPDDLVVVRRRAVQVFDAAERRLLSIRSLDDRVDAATLVGDRLAVAAGAEVSTMDPYGRDEPRVRLIAAAPVTDLVPAPDERTLLVASAGADQWVFLPPGSGGPPRAVTVHGFTSVADWESEPLAVASMGDGRSIALVQIHERSPCLAVTGIDRFDRQCLYAPGDRKPVPTADLLNGTVAQKSGTSPLEVYGELSGDVERVEVGYTLRGVELAVEAVLLRADGFSVFVAELPSRARVPIAFAYAADGAELAREGFPVPGHPQAFIGTAGPGDLPVFNASPWADAGAHVRPAEARRHDDVDVAVTATQRATGRRHLTAYANGSPSPPGCVNAREARFPPVAAGEPTSTTLRPAVGEGGPEGWCPGRYRVRVVYSGPGFRETMAKADFVVK